MIDRIIISTERLFEHNLRNEPPLTAGASTLEVTCHPSSVYDVHCSDFYRSIRRRLMMAGFEARFDEREELQQVWTYDGDPARRADVERLVDERLFDLWAWLDSAEP